MQRRHPADERELAFLRECGALSPEGAELVREVLSGLEQWAADGPPVDLVALPAQAEADRLTLLAEIQDDDMLSLSDAGMLLPAFVRTAQKTPACARASACSAGRGGGETPGRAQAVRRLFAGSLACSHARTAGLGHSQSHGYVA
jgi:hypothetical protein